MPFLVPVFPNYAAIIGNIFQNVNLFLKKESYKNQ